MLIYEIANCVFSGAVISGRVCIMACAITWCDTELYSQYKLMYCPWMPPIHSFKKYLLSTDSVSVVSESSNSCCSKWMLWLKTTEVDFLLHIKVQKVVQQVTFLGGFRNPGSSHLVAPPPTRCSYSFISSWWLRRGRWRHTPLTS